MTGRPRGYGGVPQNRRAAALGLALATLVTAACGSHLSHEEIVAAARGGQESPGAEVRAGEAAPVAPAASD
ncbi:MAG: hypothetical protein ACRDZ3_00690, partial [Acidimicrobiia bacterium]